MDNCKLAYNSQFVSSLTGASIAQLNNWDKLGLVQPSILKSKGKGSIRLYSFEDIVEIKTIIQLKANKISLPQIRIAVEYLKKELDYKRPLKEAYIVSNGMHILHTDNPSSVYSNWVAADKYGQRVLPFIVIPISAIENEIKNKVLKYEKSIIQGREEYKKGETLSFDQVKDKLFNVQTRTKTESGKRHKKT